MFFALRRGAPVALCLLLVGALPTGAQSGEAVPAPLRGVRRIVCMGDSITEYGERPGGYLLLLRRTLAALYPQQPIEVINAGVSGDKSSDMALRFSWSVLDRKPELLTIHVGLNDVWHGLPRKQNYGIELTGVSLPDFRRNLEEMVIKAKKARIRVLLIAPTLIQEDRNSQANERLRAYAAAMGEVAQKQGVLYLDAHHLFRQRLTELQKKNGAARNLLTTDGIHLNAEGNRLLAAGILGALGVPNQRLSALYNRR
jgi:lysophospholipase L1-like esterase